MSFLDLDGLTYFCSKIKSWAGSEFLGIGDTAVSAASDADGNVITETYATKDELAEAVADGVPDTIDCGTITE